MTRTALQIPITTAVLVAGLVIIPAAGVEKLRRNFLYRVPGVGVGAHRDVLAEQ